MVSAIHNGWSWDRANARLDFYYRGTRIGHIKSGEMTLANGGDFITATGNVFLGNPGAFATTQPQAAVVMGGSSLSGIAPAGAIATAGGVFASDTVVRKIIAAGTVSNVET